MSNKPILQIVDSLQIGGAQRLLITFAEQMQLRDQPLVVISLHDDRDSFMVGQLEELGVTVYQLPGKKLLDWARWQKLLKLVSEKEYQLIHTHLSYANILGTIAGRWLGIPVVATLHNVQAAKQSSLARIAETGALRYLANEITAVGSLVTDAHQARFSNKEIATIPNAVASIPELTEQERSLFRDKLVTHAADQLILLSVGRLTEQKGFSDLIVAFSILQESYPNCCLLIAGEGELQRPLQEQIEQLGLQEKVYLLGVRDDIPRLLRAADLFVSSSHWEGLPVAVLEAMSAGLPVVATKVGAVPQLIVTGTGILVDPKEPEQLASAMQNLLALPEKMKEIGVAGQTHVATHYSAAAWADRYLQLYETVKERYGAS